MYGLPDGFPREIPSFLKATMKGTSGQPSLCSVFLKQVESPTLESVLEPLNYIVAVCNCYFYPTNLWGFVLSMIVITTCMISDFFWFQWEKMLGTL